MFAIHVSTVRGIAIIQIEGVIDDQVDLAKSMPQLPVRAEIYCSKLKRFNSIGVKNWIEFFTYSKKITSFEFHECSPAVVKECNSYHNFLAGSRMHSLLLPFACEHCGTEFTKLFTVQNLRQIQFSVPAESCPNCKMEGIFDDLPDAYFAFLKRA